jgi:THO complex subunit 1
VRMVETVLSRDKNWVRWKEVNCPEISFPGVHPKEYSQATEGAKREVQWKRLRDTPMGALDLKFLSESEHNRGVDTLSEQER